MLTKMIETTSQDDLRYYFGGGKPIIYDNQLKVSLYYDQEQQEWFSMQPHVMEEQAEEITDERLIKEIFTDTLIQQYQNNNFLKDYRLYLEKIRGNNNTDIADTFLES